ncbi:MAG: dihydroorotase [Deltaproteobacteria bacterium]|nr:dihydroorotase [Deltaproteobacteria bacterium]
MRFPPPPFRPDLVVVTGVRAVDPGAGLDATVDLVVEAGRITRLGPGAFSAELRRATGAGGVAALHIDGRELWALPAFVDLHAHLREPGQEHKEDIASGLAAAAAGGFAHVCAMPNTEPANDCPEITGAMIARATALGGSRLHPVGAVTVGRRGAELADLGAMRAAGAVAFSDDGGCVMSGAIVRQALGRARELGVPIIQHAEDHSLTAGAQMHEGAVSVWLGLRGWPRHAEETIVARDLTLCAEVAGARYHVAHVSTAGTAELVREAKARGVAVSAEVTAHHLMLTDQAVAEHGTACKVSPPLREARDVEALRAALADGTVDAIATDHAPHAPREKRRPFAEAPPGMIGLELALPVLLRLVHDGIVPLARFVEALSRAPARIAGLHPPELREGAPAELCLVAPRRRHVLGPAELRSKSCNSPFVGEPLCGSVELTMAGGAIVHVRAGCEPILWSAP